MSHLLSEAGVFVLLGDDDRHRNRECHLLHRSLKKGGKKQRMPRVKAELRTHSQVARKIKARLGRVHFYAIDTDGQAVVNLVFFL